MAARRNVLILSGDYTFGSVLERGLGTDFDVHSAATDIAAFALMDAYRYACVVVDLSVPSTGAASAVSGLRLNALTIPVVALVPPGSETMLPEGATACIHDADPMPRLAKLVRQAVESRPL